VERFQEWTDPAAELPEDAVDRDHLLTDVSVYWFANTAGSSANLYYEANHDPSAFAPKAPGAPTGVAVFISHDVAIRRLAERDHNIVHWSEFDRGGHFPAMEGSRPARRRHTRVLPPIPLTRAAARLAPGRRPREATAPLPLAREALHKDVDGRGSPPAVKAMA
jgi:hypothetical protein